MFSGYQPKRSKGTGRVLVSGVTALLIYGGLGVTVFALAANRPPPLEPEPALDVTFRELPPPPPAPAPPPPPAAAAAPAPPKTKTPRRPAPDLTEPKKIPDQPLPEAEPTQADPGPPGPVEGNAGGVEGGTPGGTGTGPPAPPTPAPRPRSVPQNLPDGAVPAEPSSANAIPEFPEAARAKGVEGLVILKIVISETGAVKDVQVMKGEEPFVAAAVAAVKTWRYRPASFQGEPIAVFKIVKVPFKLSGR